MQSFYIQRQQWQLPPLWWDPSFRPNNPNQLGSSTASATVEQQREGNIQFNNATSRKSIGWQSVPSLQRHYRYETQIEGNYTPIPLLPMSQSKYATLSSSSPSKPEGKKKYYLLYTSQEFWMHQFMDQNTVSIFVIACRSIFRFARPNSFLWFMFNINEK